MVTGAGNFGKAGRGGAERGAPAVAVEFGMLSLVTDFGDGNDWMPKRLADKARWLPAEGERPEGMYVRFGGRIGRTSASLRLAGEELDPDEITRLLGHLPTSAYRKGDPVTRDGRGQRRQSLWSLTSDLPDSATINQHVSHLLQSVSQDRTVWQSLARFTPDIFVGLFLTRFNQGDSISPEVASLLAERGIELNLDIYSDTDEAD